MSEEEVASQEEVEEAPEVEEEEVEEVESGSEERDWAAEASQMGWNPEFEGENAIDAKEFVQRKPLYDEMKKLRKKTRDLESAIMAQQNIHSKNLEKQLENQRKALMAEKKQAIIDGDADKQIALDDELAKMDKMQVPQMQDGVPPEYAEFEDANPWYNTDDDMRAWADAYGLRTRQANPNKALSDIYAEVSKRAKEVFPHKFKNPKKAVAQQVETPTRGTPRAKDDPVSGMPKEVKVIAETMWKQGAFGEVTRKQALEKYAKDYTDQFGGWE